MTDWIPLGELGEIVAGSTPSTRVQGYWDGDIPWITPADLTNFQGVFFNGELRKITEAGYHSCSTKMLPVGSIIYSTRAPIGHCTVNAFPLCTNQGFKSIIPNENLDAVYGYYALRFLTPQIIAMGRGATFGEVNKEIFESIKIPVPPLPEQRRIAVLLDKADKLRRTRRYAAQLSESFLQSVFMQMFGDVVKNEMQWDVAPFENVCEISTKMVDPRIEPFCNYLHIGSDNIDSVTGNISELHTAKQDKLISTNFLFESHHILFSKIRPKLRKVAYPRIRGLCSADIYPISTVSERLNVLFLLYFLRSREFTRIVEKLAESRTNIPKVNRDEFAEQNVQLPPIALQEKFARIVQQYEHLRAQQREAERQTEHLFQTLLHKAFNGELN